MTRQEIAGRTMDNLEQVIRLYGERETIPLSAAEKLITLLESANDDALWLIIENRVKFCWLIAARIMRDRGYTIETR
jgi:hypothetical protein